MTGFSEKATAFVPVILPVEGLWLQATPMADHIRLDWNSRREQDNAGYWLQRSTDGSAFDNLVWVDGQGTSDLPTHYTWPDVQVRPGIRYYYRLRQLDYNGAGVLSNTVEAMLPVDARLSAVLFPNPARGQVSMAFNLPDTKPVLVQFFNTLGQEVYQQRLLPQDTRGTAVLDIRSLATGTYSVVIQQGDAVLTQRLVVAAR